MQASTVSTGTSFSTVESNTTTATTKSKEQILIQSSGAIIAIIVTGIIIILTILLVILKTYNRHTHVSRMLGTSGGSKSRQKMSTSAAQNGTSMRNLGIPTVSSSIAHSSSVSENGFHFPRVELSDTQRNDVELFSTTSGSTEVTIHESSSQGNT